MKFDAFVAEHFPWLSGICLGIVFLIDILLPVGYNASLLYFILPLLSLFPSAPSRGFLLPSIALLLLAGLFKPIDEIPFSVFFFNRGLMIFILIGAATLIEQRKRFERDFRQSEALQRTILSVAPIGVGMVVDRKFLWINEGISEMTGYAQRELIGKSVRIIYPSREEFERVGASNYGLIRAGGRGSIETRWRSRNGVVFDIMLNAAAIDRNDLRKGVVFTALDIRKRKLAEAEVFRQKQTFQTLAESSPDVIFLYDTDTRCRYVNGTVTRYAGKPPDSFIGKTIAGMDIPEDVKKSWEKMHGEAVSTGKSVRCEMGFPSVEGEKFFVNTYLPVFTGSGRVEAVIAFAHDVTEFKKIQKLLERRAVESEESRKILEALMENVPQGIAIADAPGARVMMVSRYGRTFGKDKRQLEGIGFEEQLKSWQFFYPDGSPVPSGDVALIAAIQRGKITISQELRMKTASGRMIPILVNAAPIRDRLGQITAGVMVWSDISTLKQAEEVLRRDKDTFERLVMDRTRELIAAQLELEQAKRLSDIGSLAATVAHELRNPLGVIRAAAFNIKRKAQESPIGPQLANIEKKIVQSDQIINNLLFYARLKKPQFERVRIYHVLRDSIESFRRRYPDLAVTEELSAVRDLVMDADPTQMNEMFNNIVSNAYDAVKEKRGRVRIAASREDSSVRFVFEDNGSGMDAGQVKKVFEPFYTTKARGTGLGLTVTKQIVGLHGGTIGIRSRKGEGTVVTVTLPVTQHPAAAAQAGAHR